MRLFGVSALGCVGVIVLRVEPGGRPGNCQVFDVATFGTRSSNVS